MSLRLLFPILLLSAAAACDFFERDAGDGEPVDTEGPTDTDGTDTDTDPSSTLAYGADCINAPASCELGTTCAGDGTCRYVGEPGTSASGDECASSEFCAFGLACDATGHCATQGSPGTAGFGQACTSDADCQVFLQCDTAGTGTCYGFQPPIWLGESCEDPALEAGPFRAYFEVPAQGATNADFYRFPIPNDARVWSGSIDLSGHPTPGPLIPALGDLAADVVDSIEIEIEAWGNNQAAFFRFSQSIDFSTLDLGVPGDGTVAIVDITPSSPDYGKRHAGGWAYSSGRRQYICHNWISLHSGTGFPMRPGNTYAALLTTDIRVDGGSTRVGQDTHFQAVLASTTPSDPTLAHAWQAYQPLRDYLADKGISSDGIAAAAVFTTQNPPEFMQSLREAVHATATPTETGLHLCDGAAGPYEDVSDPDRGCSSPSTTYHEVQGLIGLPQFQAGKPPFKTPADGGAIDFSGLPGVDHVHDVHFTLTVPKQHAMPTNGWPLVLYGHGTSGNYHSFVLNGMAEELSDVGLDGGTDVAFAVLSIDAVNHGPRRHEENWDPAWLALDPGAYDDDVLFFNPLNPAAARDNVLQAGAEYFALLRWAGALDWDAGASPTGERVRFDTDNVYYMGHSQGSQTGVGFAAYEPDVKAVVLSGAGGMLIQSLLQKTEPVNLPAALQIALADPNLTRHHPLLNLAQMYAERSDAVNHARYLFFETLGANTEKHVFHTYGIGDTLTPEDAQYALARASIVEQISNGNPLLNNISAVVEPVTGNRWGTTAVVAQFAPSTGNNGHYVMFDVPQATRQATHFLGTAVRDGTPTVVAP